MLATLTTLPAALTPVLAGGPWMVGHGGGPWFLLFPLVWILVALVVFLIVSRRRRHWARTGPGSARSTLAQRFAKGEIEEDEYRARLEVLQAADER
jgi:putative membrane protein